MAYRVPFDVPAWTYDEALAALHSALRFGIEPLLETVVDMLEELGNPDHSFSSLQVAGTNGKTSTSRYAAAILRGEGLHTALYTSPELVRYPERMEIDGRVVSDEQFARGLAAAQVAGERVNARRVAAGQRPYDVTEFDSLTVAACVVFAEAGVDVAVLEVGMGGRWDATSAIGSIRSTAVTGIGLDHMRILGDTLEDIASEKAAVIQRGRTCVLGVGTATPASVEELFLGRARSEGVTPVLLRPEQLTDAPGELEQGELRDHPELPRASYRIARRPRRLGDSLIVELTTPRASYAEIGALKPAYQAANIACAIVLCEQFLDRPLDREALAQSVVACPTPGRFDVVRPDPLGLIDACHNPQSVRVFLDAVRAIEPDPQKRPCLLAAVLADKDVAGIVELLAGEFPRVVATQTSSPRALAAAELGELFRQAGVRDVAVAPDVAAALDLLKDTPYIACGSITLAGEVAGIVRG